MKDAINLILGATLVVLGTVWWLGGVEALSGWWPALVVAVGVGLLIAGLRSEPHSLALMIAGAVILSTGLLLSLQVITGWWATWAYAWALTGPFAVGVAMFAHARRESGSVDRGPGRLLMYIGGGIFIVGLVFFEGLLGLSGFEIADYVWPIVLIVIGVLMLARGRSEGNMR